MPTLLLDRSEVESLLDPVKLVPALREAFIAYARHPGDRAQRVRASLPGPGTATVLFPGVVAGAPAYTVKVHAKFPQQRPAIRGVLCLHATESGELLAVMDSTHLTAVRTGVAGALAAHVLARADADRVAVVGAGVQGRRQLVSLAGLRRLRRVSVYDVARDASERFAAEMRAALGVAVAPAASVADALRDADIVLAATGARQPLVRPAMLRPGAHVTTLGADEPGKVEVDADVIRNALFFCDDRRLAVEMGALAGAGLSAEHVAAELGEVLAGDHPGRTSAEQVTIFAGVGLAFQDAVAALAVYDAARARGVGRSIDFLA